MTCATAIAGDHIEPYDLATKAAERPKWMICATAPRRQIEIMLMPIRKLCVSTVIGLSRSVMTATDGQSV